MERRGAEHDHRKQERRQKPRPEDCTTRDIYDLTYRVERRVSRLEEQSLALRDDYIKLATDLHRLSDDGHNHHNELMSAINYITKWSRDHEAFDNKNAHLFVGIGFVVILFLTWIAIKIASL